MGKFFMEFISKSWTPKIYYRFPEFHCFETKTLENASETQMKRKWNANEMQMKVSGCDSAHIYIHTCLHTYTYMFDEHIQHCASLPFAANLSATLAMGTDASIVSTDATGHSDETPLCELLNQESGQTGAYELKAIRIEIVDYSYPWQQQQVATQKLQVLFQSPASYSDLSMMAGPEQADIRASKSWSRG